MSAAESIDGTQIPDAEQIVAGTDLSGKQALVTGATGGLGEETARVLALGGAEVLVAGRTVASATSACRRITDRHPAARVIPLGLDLGSLADIRSCTDRLLRSARALNIVVANAGVMAVPEGRTADGFETHIGINHLGHFALITALAPLLLRGAPARVVILSSSGHRWGDVDLEHLAHGRTPYRRFNEYGASKTANILFATELDRRWKDRGVRAFAVHPGGIRDTRLSRHMSDEDRERLRRGAAGVGTRYRTIPQGAATSVWAATSTELDGTGGVYLEDCAVSSITSPKEMRGVREFAVDPERAARLWELSEQLVQTHPRKQDL